MRRCGEHTFQLTRFAALFPMNCYLVHDADGATLVDGTTASPAADVARICAERGIALPVSRSRTPTQTMPAASPAS